MTRSGWGKRALGWAAFGLLAHACIVGSQFPGDEVLGSFAFSASVLPPLAGEARCNYREMTEDGGVDGGALAGFSFPATVSRLRESGQTWLSLNGAARNATFDGGLLESPAEGVRRFDACSCEGVEVRVKESLSLRLLSQSQADVLGGCPDGGAAPPVDEDAGILPPRATPSGFDAPIACGELVDELVPTYAPGAQCGAGCVPCTVRYRLEGARQ